MDKERLKTLIINGSIIFALGLTLFIVFKLTGNGIPCPSYTILHMYCAGCGLTRMMVSLISLDFYQAFRYNAFWFISLPFLIVLLIDGVLAYLYKRETKIYKKIPTIFWIIYFVIAITFGVIRNYPPFDYLAPTDIREVKQNK